MPACGLRRGSKGGPARPVFTNTKPKPSRGAKPREADDTKIYMRGGLPRLAPDERRYLCKPHLARFT